MKRRHLTTGLTAAGLALSLAVASCSSSSSAPASSSSPSTASGVAPASGAASATSGLAGSGATSAPAGSSSSAATSTGNPAGSYSVAETEPDHLTPGNATLAYDELQALFAPLVNFKADGSLNYLQAESITSSNAAKTWTVKIRSGWKFHNGEPVTAQSYVDGWNTTAYGPNAFLNSGELSNIVGFDAVHPATGSPTAKTLSGVKVVDDTTITVDLVKSDSQFPYELSGAQLAFYPLPKAALTDLKGYDTAPIGDGPYEMDGSWQHNQQIALKAFSGYGGQKAQTGHLVFKIYSNIDTAYTDAQADNVDIVDAPQDKFATLNTDFPDRVVVAKSGSIDILGFPLFDKRYTNPKLRQAISLSIDRAAINKALYGGLYTPADSLLSPALVGGSPKSCQFCNFDPAKAKQLLADAGGWSGPMVIEYPGGSGYDQTFQAIANQIRQNLGISDVKATAASGFTEYLNNLAAKKYTEGPFRAHWGSLYPSAQNTLTALFTPTGDGNNATYYSNPAVTAKIAEANAAPDLNAATTLYHQAEQLIETDFPVVPLFFNQFPYVLSQKVANVHVQPGGGTIDFTAVTTK